MKTAKLNQFEKISLVNLIIALLLNLYSINTFSQTSSEIEVPQIRPREMNIPINYSIDYRAKNSMQVFLNYQLNVNELSLGPVKVKVDDFRFEISENQLLVFWSKQIFSNPNFIIQAKDGALIYSGQAVNKLILNDHLKILNQKIVRFCFVDSETLHKLHQYCSTYYKIDQNKLKKNKKTKSNFVEVNKQKSENNGKVELQIGQNIEFKVQFEDGSIYQWEDSPQMVWIFDIQQSDTHFIIQGIEPFPVEPYELIIKEEESKYTQLIGFEKTIKDDRKFWRSRISEQNPSLHIKQINGGIFQYQFNLSLIPTNKNKLYLDEKTSDVSYQEKSFFRGFKPKNLKLNPIKGRIKESKNDPLFIWEAATLKKHEINRAEIEIYDGNQKYLGFYEVFRGVPTELSYRVSGIIDSNGFVFTSEIALNHWFEKIFESQDSRWSKLRWGLSFKQFRTLTPVKVLLDDGSIDPMHISAINLDIKYRFTPGIWNRDETRGIMLSYQDTNYGPTRAPIAGVGWFWARSMPRVFNDLLNYFQFMKYDKWVDMELIYFPYSLSKDITLTGNYNLNFHGKIVWSESIFGEVGFGLKKYGFEDHPNNKLQDLYTIYGTAGIGINF